MILSSDGNNIFQGLSTDEYKQVNSQPNQPKIGLQCKIFSVTKIINKSRDPSLHNQFYLGLQY